MYCLILLGVLSTRSASSSMRLPLLSEWWDGVCDGWGDDLSSPCPHCWLSGPFRLSSAIGGIEDNGDDTSRLQQVDWTCGLRTSFSISPSCGLPPSVPGGSSCSFASRANRLLRREYDFVGGCPFLLSGIVFCAVSDSDMYTPSWVSKNV